DCSDEAPRVHHAARRHGGRVAARGPQIPQAVVSPGQRGDELGSLEFPVFAQHAHPTARDATDCAFNFPPPGSENFLAHPVVGRHVSQISATFVVERDGRLVESDPCEGSQAAVRLFFQHRGDDLTAAKEFHRWWSMEMFLLNTDTKAGLTVALDPSLWLSVLGKVGNSSAEVTAAFQAAAGDGENVGGAFWGLLPRPVGLVVAGHSRVLKY